MVAIPPLVDSRGYKLVADLPRSNDFANALQGMVKRGAAKDRAYEDKKTMRQAGLLAQLSRISDEDQYSSYLQNAIANAQDDEERGELEQLSQYDRATGQQIASGMVRQAGLGNMLAAESTAQSKAWDVGEDVQPTGDKDGDKPTYQRYTLTKIMGDDGIEIVRSAIGGPATIDQINREKFSGALASESGKGAGFVSTAGEVGDAKAGIAGKVELAKGKAQVETATDRASVDAEAKRLSDQATNQEKAAENAMNRVASIGVKVAALNDAIEALKGGARTGPIYSKLPSFKAETIKLEKAAADLGLGTLSEATFGALSENELKFVLEKDIPTAMNEVDLLAHLEGKKAAFENVQQVMLQASKFLSQPGNTRAMWLERSGGVNTKSTGITPEQQTALDAKYGL